MINFEAVFDFQKNTGAEIWQALIEQIKAVESIHSTKPMNVVKVFNRLKRKREVGFHENYARGYLTYGGVKNHNVSVLIGKGLARFPDDESPFEALTQRHGYILGRLYDDAYSRWQNAKDPLLYEAEGKDWRNLPIKSNGLPYPLEKNEIDISGNPGRRIFREGYIEAIGHVMWLSPKFWKRTGSTLQDVLQACPEATAHKCGEVDVLKFQDRPFTSAQGLEGDLQKRIRSALFPPKGGVPHVPVIFAIIRDSQPILFQDWLQLAETDPDLEYQKEISATNPKTGEVISMQEEAVKWTVNSSLFLFENGEIWTDDPTEDTLQKMRDLASLLNATVIRRNT